MIEPLEASTATRRLPRTILLITLTTLGCKWWLACAKVRVVCEHLDFVVRVYPLDRIAQAHRNHG